MIHPLKNKNNNKKKLKKKKKNTKDVPFNKQREREKKIAYDL